MPLPEKITQAFQRTDATVDSSLPRLVAGAAIILGAFLLTRLVQLWINRVLKRHREAGSLEPESSTRLLMTRRLGTALVWVVAVAFTLSLFPHLRVLSAGLLASAGLSGLVVGFAAQGTLGNAIAGITISFAQPLRIGDEIEFRLERGTVEDITLLHTILRLADAKRLVIPNNVLSSEVIKNLTMGQATRLTRTEVLVPLASDPGAVREAMLAEARGFPALDHDAPPPEVFWARIDERGVLLRLVATCRDQAAADQLSQRVFGSAVALAWPTAPPPAAPAPKA